MVDVKTQKFSLTKFTVSEIKYKIYSSKIRYKENS